LKIAVIIVSWNVKELVGQCIASIYKYLKGKHYDIFLVDNASSDNTVNFVRESYPDVKVIANKTNIGFAAANNQAVRATDAEILVFANPDTELTGTIDPLILKLADPRIVASFGRLVYPSGITQDFIRNFPTIINQLGEISGLPHLFPKLSWAHEMIRNINSAQYGKMHFIDAASGAFFVMKRDSFVEAGMFDENFFVYGEDMDLFYRLRKKGYKILYDPNVKIIHHHGKSTSQNPMMYKMEQKNRYLFVKKNYSTAQALLYRYVLFLSYDVLRLGLTMLKLLLNTQDSRRKYYGKVIGHFRAIIWELFGE